MGTVGVMSLAARDLPRRMTADEFLAATDELPRAQLIDGELVEAVNPPRSRHQQIVQRLLVSFATGLGPAGHGELWLPQGLRVDDANVFVPDLFWIRAGTTLDPDAHVLDSVPPLVIEVLSPSTRAHDTGPKLDGYLRAGVTEVWLVDPDTPTITVHHRGQAPTTLVAGDILTTPQIPDWEIDLTTLFA